MKILMAALAITLSASAQELIFDAPITSSNHRAYVEPDFAWNISHTYKDGDIHQTEWGQFYGLTSGYEYVKPNYLYAGIELAASIGQRSGEVTDPAELEIIKYERIVSKSKLEGKLGYTLKTNNTTITPYSGIAGMVFGDKHSDLLMAYIPIGIQAEYQFRNLSIGLKGEQMHFLRNWNYFDDHSTSNSMWHSGFYGYEISAPVSFKVGVINGRNICCSLEPYYQKLFSDLSFAGGRIAVMARY